MNGNSRYAGPACRVIQKVAFSLLVLQIFRILRAQAHPRGKKADFEKMLDSVGNPWDLKKFYQGRGNRDAGDYKGNAVDDFILAKERAWFALYQANVLATPRYTLCKALNDGVEYDIRGLDGSTFSALLRKLTSASESNKIFQNTNNLSTYKAGFAEF